MPIFEKYAPRMDRALIEPRCLPVPLCTGVGSAVPITGAFSGIGHTVSESAATEGIRVDERSGEIGVRIEP